MLQRTYHRTRVVAQGGQVGGTARAPCSWHTASARAATDEQLRRGFQCSEHRPKRGVARSLRQSSPVAGKARRGASQESLRHVCLLEGRRRGRCARLAAGSEQAKYQSRHMTDRRDTVACARMGTSASAVLSTALLRRAAQGARRGGCVCMRACAVRTYAAGVLAEGAKHASKI